MRLQNLQDGVSASLQTVSQIQPKMLKEWRRKEISRDHRLMTISLRQFKRVKWMKGEILIGRMLQI